MSNLETAQAETVSDPAASQNAPTEEQVKTEPAQEVVVEQKAEEKAPEPQKDKFAPKFAALSRKERELRQREKELTERIAKQEAEIQARLKQAEEFESKRAERERLKKENPVKFLEEEGLTYEQVTKSILNNGELSKEEKIEQLIAAQSEEVKKLQQKLEEKERKEKEDAEKAELDASEKKHKETVAAFKTEVKSFLDANPSDYELLMNNPLGEDPVDAVYETVAEYYREHKEVLDIKAAADLIEKFLEERVEKLTKTKKVSSKLAPPKEEPKQEPVQSQSPKTLENAHSSITPNRQGRKLTEDELIAEAAKFVRFQKN